MRFSDLEKERVAILGAGREGRAVWRQIRRRFPDKRLSFYAEADIDAQFQKELDPLLDGISIAPLNYDELKQFDVLIRSAGISPYRPELKQLRDDGKRFTSASSLWFAENPQAKTICISGTMGKSTTAKLVAHLLAYAGVKACLAGNIGQHMLDSEDTNIDWWVIELSSYQLSDLEARPDAALLLNLSEEHVDWHGSVERYISDKLRLAKLASAGQVIANFSDETLKQRLQTQQNIVWFNQPTSWQACEGGVIDRHKTFVPAPVSLPGAHNMQNLAAAMALIDVLGLKIQDLGAALSSFRGLPHRQQYIGRKAGVRYINDSISTTPVSVAAALQTFGTKDVVLLLGGLDRGLDWTGFAAQLANHTPFAIITIPDNGTMIYAALQAAGVKPMGGLHQASELSGAVALAQEIAPKNGFILLSPGAPSFPHFKDYADRGEQFEKLADI